MTHKNLNYLLKIYFAKPSKYGLESLENDVWSRIESDNSANLDSWLAGILEGFAAPQLRFASLAVALTIGFMVGALSMSAEIRTSDATALGLTVFSPDSHYLASNILNGNS